MARVRASICVAVVLALSAGWVERSPAVASRPSLRPNVHGPQCAGALRAADVLHDELGQELELADSAFSPGAVKCDFGELSKDSIHLNDPTMWPRFTHSAPYSTWGVLGGYLQFGAWTPAGASDNVCVESR